MRKRTTEKLAPPMADPLCCGSLPLMRNECDFEAFAHQTRTCFKRNKSADALQRVHSYTLKCSRRIGETHGIAVAHDKALESLLTEYVEKHQDEGRLESAMSVRLLRMNIATILAFNKMHNARSLTNGDKALNDHESLLVFDRVATSLRFLITQEYQVSAAAQ